MLPKMCEKQVLYGMSKKFVESLKLLGNKRDKKNPWEH